MIEYREFGAEELFRVRALYEDVGWAAYLSDSEKLARAFAVSLYVLGAFRNDMLIGFIRCVGDGEHIVYVQDLIVDSAYRRQGIGRALLQKARDTYRYVRMFALMTDGSDRNANSFYQAIKMRSYEDAGLIGYLWQDTALERKQH